MLAKADGVNVAEADPFIRARQSGLDIRYTTISDGFPPDFDRILNYKQHWEAIFLDFPSRVDELIGNIIHSDDEAFKHFLVADTLYSLPATIAYKYNMLNVSFWTQPALVFTLYYHLDLLREKGYFPIQGDEENVIIDANAIPGIEPIKIKAKYLTSNFHDLDETSITRRITVEAFEKVKQADFILINTVDELEHEWVSAMNQMQPTYAIGPVNFTKLDVAEEIANGILLSGVHFVWVIRDGANILPYGFANDSKDRGVIVSWCNQNAVLSNPAIGGFLTHCRWNSILEFICCGVPMICYPFFADQPTNRKLVVDDWKVGTNLCEGTSVDRKEVAEKIKELISSETSNSLRGEMKRMSSVVHKALDEDGSTHKNFHRFLDDLWAKAASDTHGRKFFTSQYRENR
ncbi:hypothetical protein SASPL_102240 [Salvia splendens]|uniref:Uncharacterized protein n=1 Tax=Salvia splendens TaxID=180675 RepID=A0A8X8YVX9_SALSN|nr:hypothetical protein SASPL_102240 [Salvia splendens]